MLVDALEKLAGGRGATSAVGRCQRHRAEFFAKRGYVAMQRNSVTVNDEWLANTTMQKTLGATPRRSAAMSRERLYLFDTTLRDGAQTNGVDFTLHDKQVIAAMLDDLGIDYVEGGYPGANPTDTEFFAHQAEARPRALHRVRHDAPGRALGLQRSRRGRRCSKRRPTRSASWRSRRPIRCASRWRRRRRKISPRSATASRRRRPPAAR